MLLIALSVRGERGSTVLELRNPDADNSKAETWAASKETAGADWTTVTFRKIADDPLEPRVCCDRFPEDVITHYNEFIFGMLDSGEFLLDDVRVTRNPGGGATQLIRTPFGPHS